MWCGEPVGMDDDPDSLLVGLDFDDLFEDDFTAQDQLPPASGKNGAVVAVGAPLPGSQVPGGRPPEDLQNVLQTKEGEIAILRANTEKQARLIEALRSQLEAKEQEVAASQMQLSDGLSHELENMRTQLAFRDRELEELEGEVKRHKREREAQQRQAEASRGQQQALQQELARLRSALASAQQQPQNQAPKYSPPPQQQPPQAPPPPAPADTVAGSSARLLLGDLLGPASGPGQQGTLVALTQTLCAATTLAPDTKPRLLTVVAEALRQLGSGQGQGWLLLLGLADTLLAVLLQSEAQQPTSAPSSLQPITQLAPRKRPRLATPTATLGATVLVCRDWALLAEVLAVLRRLLCGCPEARTLLATHMGPTVQPTAQPATAASRVAQRVAHGRMVLNPAAMEAVQQQLAGAQAEAHDQALLGAEVGGTLLALLAWMDPTHQVPPGVLVLVLQCLACTASAWPALTDPSLAPHAPALARLCLRAAQAEDHAMHSLLGAGLQLLTAMAAQKAFTAQLLATHGAGGASCMLGHMAGALSCMASGHGTATGPQRGAVEAGSGWLAASMAGWEQQLLAVRLLGVAWCSMPQWPAGPCGCQQDALRGLVDVLDRCCAAYMATAEWQQGGASGRLQLVSRLGAGQHVLLEGLGLLAGLVAADQRCLGLLARVAYTALSAMRRLAALFAALGAAVASAQHACANGLVEQLQLAEQQASDLANHLEGDTEGEGPIDESIE